MPFEILVGWGYLNLRKSVILDAATEESHFRSSVCVTVWWNWSAPTMPGQILLDSFTVQSVWLCWSENHVSTLHKNLEVILNSVCCWSEYLFLNACFIVHSSAIDKSCFNSLHFYEKKKYLKTWTTWILELRSLWIIDKNKLSANISLA